MRVRMTKPKEKDNEQSKTNEETVIARTESGNCQSENNTRHQSDRVRNSVDDSVQPGEHRPALQVQQRRSNGRRDNGDILGPSTSHRGIFTVRKSGIRRGDGSENRSGDSTYRRARVRAEYLRLSFTDDDLRRLLNNDFQPYETFNIIIGVEVGEDRIIKKKRRRLGPVVKKKIKLRTYDLYVPQYQSWKQRSDTTCTSSVVFGCYLLMYKQAFDEEDPEWAGVKNGAAKVPLTYIINMIHELNIDSAEVVEFVEEILPLWAKAMSKGGNFPTTRPTYKTFFQNRRVWAQRFAYFKQWANL